MTPIDLCPVTRGGAHCEELANHKPVNGFDHYAHSLGMGWNDKAERSWEDELLESLPPHRYVETREWRSILGSGYQGLVWSATFTTPTGGWSVYRPVEEVEPRVTVRGNGVKVQLDNPVPQTVIDTLRLHGALDDPAVTGVSWEARRFLAGQLAEYIGQCAGRLAAQGELTTHDEAHVNGMSAAVSWLYGEIGTKS